MISNHSFCGAKPSYFLLTFCASILLTVLQKPHSSLCMEKLMGKKEGLKKDWKTINRKQVISIRKVLDNKYQVCSPSLVVFEMNSYKETQSIKRKFESFCVFEKYFFYGTFDPVVLNKFFHISVKISIHYVMGNSKLFIF